LFVVTYSYMKTIMKSKILTLIALLLGTAGIALADHHGNTIELTGNDTMQFSSKAFEVAVGEEITLVFKNLGTLPKVAMGHNVVILKPGTQPAAFGMAAISAAANEYIPQDEANKALVIAHTKLLGPGETDTITFTLTEAGSYPYICSFPGHFGLMSGIITAK
jgi:azurin